MIAVDSSSQSRGLLGGLVYSALFVLFTAADLASTNWFLREVGGREMNAYMLDAATGTLSMRFVAIHFVLMLLCTVAFAFALSQLGSAEARALTARDALLSFRSDQGRGAFRWAFLAAAILIMKLLVPVSNLAEGWGGLGAPSLVRTILNDPGEGVVLSVVIVVTVAVAFALAGPAVRWAAVHSHTQR